MKNTIVFCSTFLYRCFYFLARETIKKTLDTVIQYLANIECRAMAARNERFALANKIRFEQDKLATIKLHTDSLLIQAELVKNGVQKNSILTISLHLAGSIKIQMDYILAHYLTNKAKEKEFNKALDALLLKKGCK
jgi:hypothetical protein